MNRACNTMVSVAAMLVAVSGAACTNVVNTGRVVLQPEDASRGDGPLTPEDLCLTTGGTVVTRTCCANTIDFPMMCWNATCASCQAGTPMGGPTRQARLCVCPTNWCYSQTFSGGGCHPAVMSSDDGGMRDLPNQSDSTGGSADATGSSEALSARIDANSGT